jgi:hypothetical protein
MVFSGMVLPMRGRSSDSVQTFARSAWASRESDAKAHGRDGMVARPKGMALAWRPRFPQDFAEQRRHMPSTFRALMDLNAPHCEHFMTPVISWRV